jgi:hypothetical protein
VVRSNVALPELVPASRRVPDVALTWTVGARVRREPCRWFDEWRENGDLWLAFGRMDGRYLLRFPRIADFVVSDDGQHVAAYHRRATDRATVRHVFLDQVLPLILSARGALALHASAVLAPGGAIAFTGKSGSGKSTLAASFGAAGFPFVADDYVGLTEEDGTIMAVPSYPGLRLWPDMLPAVPRLRAPSSKRFRKLRTAAATAGFRYRRTPAALRRIYVLSGERRESGVAVSIPSVRDSVMDLLRHAYRLDRTDRSALTRELDLAAHVAQQWIVRRLAFARTISGLDDVRAAILDDLARG